MNKTPKSRILGTGRSVPERVLTNFDLEKMVDTSDEWIRVRTGIERRHIVSENESTSTMCTEAASNALEKAGVAAEQIDVIVVATVTGDIGFPSTGCLIQKNIGATNAAAFDIAAACSGFIYGLRVADTMIACGDVKHALVVGGETLSKITNWKDRSTCVLFGDGAGAVVLGPAGGGESGLIDHFIKSDGRLVDLLYRKGGGTKIPYEVQVAEDMMGIHMEGKEVFRHAVTAMGDSAVNILERNGLTGEDVDILIPHQANKRIITATARRLNLPLEKVYINLQEYGNTSAASIPIAMDEALEKNVITSGDLGVLVAFGGGFTWGSALIKF